jgi:hypothetical protein
MNYPLKLTFKIFSLASELKITDGTGATICSMKRKAFTLKEKITIFSDDANTDALFTIETKKVFAASPKYFFTDAKTGKSFGSVINNGWKSLWNIDYDIFDPDAEVATLKINEENPWIKVADAVLSEIPIIGLASSFLLHPSYAIERDGRKLMRLKKEPSLVARQFKIESIEAMKPEEETRSLLALMVMILSARQRG